MQSEFREPAGQNLRTLSGIFKKEFIQSPGVSITETKMFMMGYK